MGILSALRLTKSVASSSLVAPSAQRGIRSPWTQGQLSQVVFADVFGLDTLLVSRAEAMKVPSVAKARHTLVGAMAGMPLRALAGETLLENQPTWLYRTNGAISPWHRMAWTIDDLLFGDWSLWAAARGADNALLDTERIPLEWWRFTAEGGVEVLNPHTGTFYEPPASELILIPGPGACLLENAATTIRAARSLETAWAGRIKNPIPASELHQVTDDVLTDEEITDLIDTYCDARNDPNGTVVYTPNSIELRTHGESSADMFTEARNAVRLDVANFTGLPGAALDGALATASLTYVTQDGKRSELADSIDLWTGAIEARLSQDDCVPRGQRVRFDKGNSFTPSPTGPTVED